MTTAGFTKTSLTNQHLQIAMETRRDTKKLISGQQAIARAIEQPSFSLVRINNGHKFIES